MKVALAEVSVVDEIFCEPTAVLSLGRKLVSHDPRALRVDRCWRIVYQPNGCARRLTGMNVAFFDRTFPELVYLHFITSTYLQSNIKISKFRADLSRLLLKFHAVMQHHKYIDHPRH